MVITLPPELETALNELARRRGVAPEILSLDVSQAPKERKFIAWGLSPRTRLHLSFVPKARSFRV